MEKLLRSLLVLNLVLAITASFSEHCPPECKCAWVSGKKRADCYHSKLQQIPNDLSIEIQILDLTGNELKEIKRNTFKNSGLMNLHNLILRDCKLLTIDKNAFTGLDILISLDLSKNLLTTLHGDTFKSTERIKHILLNDNQLEKLEDGLFKNLNFLQKIDLSNNRITEVGLNTFSYLQNLNYLLLHGNKLETLEVDVVRGLSSLTYFDIAENPWKCDCYLVLFVEWVKSNNLISSSVSCAGPEKVQEKLWDELNSSDLVC